MKASIQTEILAGLTTFLATMYIIIVNPVILSQSGMPFNAVVTATVLVASLSSILMGLYAKNPIVLAPGMGLNAFFTFGVVIGMKIPWPTALGAVFWSGIVFILLSIFNIRSYIANAIPKQLRYSISVGIGLLIAVIGLMNAGFIVDHPATLITRGPINSITATFILGLLFTCALIIKKVKGALLFGIMATTIALIPIGRYWGDASQLNHGVKTLITWKGIFSAPDFSTFFKLDFVGSLKFSMLPVIFSFIFADMFDSLSTFIGVSEAADLLDEEGNPKNLKKSLIVDGISTTVSGLFGTSAGTSYIESAAGVQEGGRTGLTAIIAGLLFLPFLFLSPLISMIPTVATAPALILVGVYMMGPITKINWKTMEDALPAFLSLILIPMTYSISQGIIWGFLSWSLIRLFTGKGKEVSPTLWAIDLMAILSVMI
jgi:adenine/guanine/hypoxanthine permease